MSKQKLELTWIGKEKRPKLEPRILLEDPDKSYHAKHSVSDKDIFDNRLIFGDNLLALKAEFAGKVKCVFIDPPYNTGIAFTHYDDGLEHSIWLGLMRDRLEIIRRLLSEDGSLWITIDDNEAHYLKVLCDEVFGRSNFVANAIWQKKYAPANDALWLSDSHDHILVYAKSKDTWRPNKLARTAEQDLLYKNPDNDPRGPWMSDNYPDTGGRAIAEGWSRATLEVQIRNRLHERQGQAVTNFDSRLPVPHSELAHETLKDPYLFDFLGLGDEAHERDIENALVRHITKFLLELGSGFAFIGRQFRLEVEGDEFFLDLLFYHTRLKCYVVVELKATAFKPEHAGQLNFYLTAVDRQFKAPDDKPTIGLLLCKTKKRTVAEYALSGIDKPIGVAEYQLVRALPEPLVTSLPTVEELESELGAIDDGEEG